MTVLDVPYSLDDDYLRALDAPFGERAFECLPDRHQGDLYMYIYYMCVYIYIYMYIHI